MKSLLTSLLITILVLTFQSTIVAQWLPTGTVTTDAKYRSGSIGIGMTSAPLSGTTLQLHSTSGPVMTLSNATSTANALLGSIIGRGNGYSQNSAKIDMNIEDLWAGGNYSSRISFWTTGNDATMTERMRINKSGNVGIGTTTPGTGVRLNVLGGKVLFGANSTDISSLTNLEVVNGSLISLSTSTNSSYLSITHNGIIAADRTGTGTYQPLMFKTNNAERLRVLTNGNVLINKTTQTNSNYKLDVAGKIRADEVVVNTTGADFVFADDYKLRSIKEVETFIKENKHLPEIPNAKEMQEGGMSVSEINTKLLQKIEELTLYIIDQEKRISLLENKK